VLIKRLLEFWLFGTAIKFVMFVGKMWFPLVFKWVTEQDKVSCLHCYFRDISDNVMEVYFVGFTVTRPVLKREILAQYLTPNITSQD